MIMNEERSLTSPVFMQSAEDLVGRLDRFGGADAVVMAREARDLVDEFRSWALRRPLESDRFAAIDRLFALNRRAMDWMAQRDPVSTPPTSGVRSSHPGPDTGHVHLATPVPPPDSNPPPHDGEPSSRRV
jgi:hypothetical protein